MAPSEPFPLLNTSADQTLSATRNATQRVRHKSSGQKLSEDTSLANISSSNLSSTTPSSSSQVHQLSEQGKGPRRRKKRSTWQRCIRFGIKHTWTIPLLLILGFITLYGINPSEENIIHHFIFLSYRLDSLEVGGDSNAPVHYGKGLWDVAFVAFYTIVLTFTREFIMQELLRPLARYYGITSRGKQARFMEQMYTAVYFAVLGPVGVYVMSRTPVWYFNTRGMYESFPHMTHEADFKFYYLFQAAYWAQQAVVLMLGMEKPRKDFKELVGHHIVTLALIALSYRFHFMYMGIAVYLTHDISDFFLATSKSLNYINSRFEAPYFGIFVCIWVYLRHYINLRIILSLFNEFQTIGPYELNWETQQYKCLLSNVIALGLLTALQALNLFWLYCIMRAAYRIVVYKIAKDDRSDDEDEDEEVEELEYKNEETVKMLTKKVEALPLLNGNGFATVVQTK